MRLVEQLEREGGFLFRWRSFVPLVILPAALPALYDAAQFEAQWGQIADHVWAYGCVALSFVGLAIRWLTVGFAAPGTSGRNTRAQRAETLNTTGMYAIVRNPLYLGNFVAILGLALSTKAWWFVLIVALAYWLYIERIVAAEERFLAEKFGAAYETWARQTPVLIPRVSRWRRSAEPFSLRTVLRREYNGVLAVAASYFILEAVTDLLIEGEPLASWVVEDRPWVWLVVAAALVFLALRFLKKHSRILADRPRL